MADAAKHAVVQHRLRRQDDDARLTCMFDGQEIRTDHRLDGAGMADDTEAFGHRPRGRLRLGAVVVAQAIDTLLVDFARRGCLLLAAIGEHQRPDGAFLGRVDIQQATAEEEKVCVAERIGIVERFAQQMHAALGQAVALEAQPFLGAMRLEIGAFEKLTLQQWPELRRQRRPRGREIDEIDVPGAEIKADFIAVVDEQRRQILAEPLVDARKQLSQATGAALGRFRLPDQPAHDVAIETRFRRHRQHGQQQIGFFRQGDVAMITRDQPRPPDQGDAQLCALGRIPAAQVISPHGVSHPSLPLRHMLLSPSMKGAIES